MNAFAITMLDIIINHGNEAVKCAALVACRNELVGASTDDTAPMASAVVADAHVSAPVAMPLVAAAVAPTVIDVLPADTHASLDEECDYEYDRPSEALSERDARAVAYDELYEEGKGQYLLLDDEDEIQEGDEWIIKPGLSTNRARCWRDADSIGHEVSEFTRSHYRRRV